MSKRSKAVALLTVGLGSLALGACDRADDCNSANRQSAACQGQTPNTAHGGTYVAGTGARPVSPAVGGFTSGAVGSSSSDAASAASAPSSAVATAHGGFGAAGDAAAAAGGHGGGGGE